VRRTDKRCAQAHLNEAIRQLAAARVVIQQLETDAEISNGERTELSDITSVVSSLAGQVSEALNGRILDLKLANTVVTPTEDGPGPT